MSEGWHPKARARNQTLFLLQVHGSAFCFSYRVTYDWRTDAGEAGVVTARMAYERPSSARPRSATSLTRTTQERPQWMSGPSLRIRAYVQILFHIYTELTSACDWTRVLQDWKRNGRKRLDLQ